MEKIKNYTIKITATERVKNLDVCKRCRQHDVVEDSDELCDYCTQDLMYVGTLMGVL